jgi:hypothetical protein
VAANPIQFTVLAAKLIPVTFTVNNATPTSPGDYIFVTGNTVELGHWGTTFDTAVGPLLDPNYPNWFLNVSVPAGQTLQFKFVKIAASGTVTWENGSNHSYVCRPNERRRVCQRELAILMRLPGRGMRPGNFVCSDNREIGRVARRIACISAVAATPASEHAGQ